MVSRRETFFSELSSANISVLLQSPKKWTPKHLDLLRVRLIEDVPAAELVGGYAPKDGNRGTYTYNRPAFGDILCPWLIIILPAEFEKVAALFCKPSREELDWFVPLDNPSDNPFFLVFPLFRDLLKYDVDVCPPAFKDFLSSLVHRTMMMTDAAEGL